MERLWLYTKNTLPQKMYFLFYFYNIQDFHQNEKLTHFIIYCFNRHDQQVTWP